MKKEAFQLLHDMEDSWWYRGREKITTKVLNKFLLIVTFDKLKVLVKVLLACWLLNNQKLFCLKGQINF